MNGEPPELDRRLTALLRQCHLLQPLPNFRQRRQQHVA